MPGTSEARVLTERSAFIRVHPRPIQRLTLILGTIDDAIWRARRCDVSLRVSNVRDGLCICRWADFRVEAIRLGERCPSGGRSGATVTGKERV